MLIRLIEITGSILSVLCVWSSGSLSRYTWILSFIASAINMLLYIHIQRYGHAALDVFYMGCCLAGYSLWSEPGRTVYCSTPIEKVSIIITIIIMAFAANFFLRNIGSQDCFMDSLSLSSGVVAVSLMTFKIIDQWWLWGVHDLFNFILSIRAGLYVVAAKQFLYIALALRGYALWKKTTTANATA